MMRTKRTTVYAVAEKRAKKVEEGREWFRRVAIYFDMQNLYYAAKRLYQAKINYPALLHLLLADRQLVEAIGYAVRGNNFGEETFFESLRQERIKLKIMPLKSFGEGEHIKHKGNWDVGMAIDAVFAPRDKDVNVVIFVTGDGDFIPAVKKLKEEGVHVEVASFKEYTSSSLIHCVGEDKFLEIGAYEHILLPYKETAPAM